MGGGLQRAGTAQRALLTATALALCAAMLVGVGPTPVSLAAPAASSYDDRGADGTIYRLYRAYFLREPDRAGYDYWLGVHRSGHPLTDISEQFARSGEFHDRYGTVPDRDFITLVYRNVLDRSPDASGHSYWLDQMENRGMSRGGLVLSFSDSAEFRAKHPGDAPPATEARFDAAFGAATPEALALLDFTERHELEAVRVSATIEGLARDDLYRVDDSRVALFVPGTCTQFCEGDAYELVLRDVDSVADASVSYDSGAWVIRGRFVVNSVQIQTGGIFSIALRAVPIA